MKQSNLTLSQSQIASAVLIYLRLAFPGDSKPRRRVPDIASFPDIAATLAAFELDLAPQEPDLDGFSPRQTCRRYVLRIGNHAYPHMKFTIEQSADLKDWFFAVDCHDSAVRCPTPADEEAWRPILEQNRAIREAIETAWDAADLPSRRSCTQAALQRAKHSPSARLTSALSESSPMVGTSGPLVMVVDDEEDAAELFSIYLRRAGFRTIVVSDPCDAISVATVHRPDLILLDYMMEPISGRELLEQIRSKKTLQRIPTIICTYAELTLCDFPSANLVLRKPLSREQLVSQVADTLAVRSAR